jgi:uncharacterized phage protein (TIGR02220 family)
MHREVRFTVRMSRAEHDALEALAELHERDKGKMIRWLIKIAAMSDSVGKCSSDVRLACVTDASGVRLASDVYGQKNDGTENATRAHGHSPEKKEEKKKKKKKDPELAPLDVTGRILADLNKRAGTGFQARGKVARRLIAARLNDGYKEADFIEVNRKKCIEWKDNPKMKGSLTYETLYGPKFEKYVGQLESSGAQQPMFGGPTQRKSQDYSKRTPEGDTNDF